MSQSVQEIDVRILPPTARHAEIFRSFDALDPDGAIVLTLDHYPKPLLHQLQAQRSGGFDWNVLEMGPTQFRVEVRRRTSPGLRSVSECLETDHRRLDEILNRVIRGIDANDFSFASARFSEFSCGLDRHILIEEHVLFPVFERLTGRSGGPTAVMRAEHSQIRELLSDVGHALDGQDGAAARTSIDALVEVLSSHNLKEERILYPMSDRAAGDAQKQHELVENLQAF
jgi:uncharacterized protein (DUF2249 family)/hemerythrin-like domain-containing protein